MHFVPGSQVWAAGTALPLGTSAHAVDNAKQLLAGGNSMPQDVDMVGGTARIYASHVSFVRSRMTGEARRPGIERQTPQMFQRQPRHMAPVAQVGNCVDIYRKLARHGPLRSTKRLAKLVWFAE